jgi:hypothetical protein
MNEELNMAKKKKINDITGKLAIWKLTYNRKSLIEDLETLKDLIRDIRETDGDISLRTLRNSETAIGRLILANNAAYRKMDNYQHPSDYHDLVDLEDNPKNLESYIPWYVERAADNDQ